MKLKLILVQWQIQNQSKSKWWFVIRFGLKICFCSPSWFGNFGGAIFTLWLNLVKLHEKKSGSIPKILPWSLKFLSVYKLVVVNTSNGFFSIKFDHKHDVLQSKKSLFFIQISTELHCWFQIFILLWSHVTSKRYVIKKLK